MMFNQGPLEDAVESFVVDFGAETTEDEDSENDGH